MIPTATLSYDFIKDLYQQNGFPFQKEKEIINVTGYRSKDLLVDQFNDIILAAYKDFYGDRQCLLFPGTTKPGLYYLQKELGNIEGTFIMAKGFYLNCWMVNPDPAGKHKIIQAGPGVFRGHRDRNADGKLDETGLIYTDSTGVDLHTTRSDVNVTNVVDRFSAGCQVLWEDKHFGVIYNLILRSLELQPIKKISYALFVEP